MRTPNHVACWYCGHDASCMAATTLRVFHAGSCSTLVDVPSLYLCNDLVCWGALIDTLRTRVGKERAP